jgi:release factor glutamine methyltransferase
VEVYASDVDPVAVACARRNLSPERVFEGDLYDALPADLTGRVDVLAVNAPYVPTDAIATMPSEARDHEPRRALDGGADGVALHRRVAEGADRWLVPGGRLLIETGRAQAVLTVGACTAAGLVAEVVTDDDLDATAVVAGRP